MVPWGTGLSSANLSRPKKFRQPSGSCFQVAPRSLVVLMIEYPLSAPTCSSRQADAFSGTSFSPRLGEIPIHSDERIPGSTLLRASSLHVGEYRSCRRRLAL